MIAVELAITIAPPTPCTIRITMISSAPALPLFGTSAQPIEPSVKIRKPRLNSLRPAVLVAQPAERHDEHGGDEQEAHQHPEQVGDVLRGERVEAEAVEDRRQRDQQDRGVQRGGQDADRRDRQRDAAIMGFGVLHSGSFRSLASLTTRTHRGVQPGSVDSSL